MSMTLFAKNETLGYAFTALTLETRPVSWEVSLHTGDPGNTGANEVTDAAYVRQAVVFELDDVAGAVSNDAEIVFPAAAAEYTFTYVAVVDNAGNFWCKQLLSAPRVIAIAGSARIATGELLIGGNA